LSKTKGRFVILQYDALTDQYSRYIPTYFHKVSEAETEIKLWSQDSPDLAKTLSVVEVSYAAILIKLWHTWPNPQDQELNTSSVAEESIQEPELSQQN